MTKNWKMVGILHANKKNSCCPPPGIWASYSTGRPSATNERDCPRNENPSSPAGTTIGNPHTHDKSDVRSNSGHLKDVLEYLLSHCVEGSSPSIIESCGTSAGTSEATFFPLHFALARAADFIISGEVILLNSSQRACVASAIFTKLVRNLFGGFGALALEEQPTTVGPASAMLKTNTNN